MTLLEDDREDRREELTELVNSRYDIIKEKQAKKIALHQLVKQAEELQDVLAAQDRELNPEPTDREEAAGHDSDHHSHGDSFPPTKSAGEIEGEMHELQASMEALIKGPEKRGKLKRISEKYLVDITRRWLTNNTDKPKDILQRLQQHHVLKGQHGHNHAQQKGN